MGFDWQKNLRVYALKHKLTRTNFLSSNHSFFGSHVLTERCLCFHYCICYAVTSQTPFILYHLPSIKKQSPLIKDPLHPFVSRISRVMELFSSPIIFIWEIRYYYKQSNSNSLGKDVMLYEHSIIRANLRH